MFLEILFWTAAFLFLLNYFIYPLAVILLARNSSSRSGEATVPDSYQPSVTLIIAAYNEAKVIRNKIANSLALDYPDNLLEIILVSDGSDDDTHEIALEYAESGIVAMHEPQRRGKSAAINRAAESAGGEILLLSDANNDFNEEAVFAITRPFFNDSIGAVTGAKHIYDDAERESSRGDSAYWKYESAIKQAESRLGSITSGDGEIFAVRKSLFHPIDTRLINDDAAITFDLVKRGYRVAYEPAAKSFEKASKDLLDDYHVKVRMAAGGFQSIAADRRFLFPPRCWFAVSFILHKILRWLTPVFLITLYLGSFLLARNSFYLVLLVLQSIFYAASYYGWMNRKRSDIPLYIYIPMYFSVMNLALLFGLFKFLAGGQGVKWKKAER